MIFLTHAAFGLLLGIILVKSSAVPAASFVTAVVFSSLLPDIDRGTTFLGRYLKPWNSFLKHRGFFHSIPAMIMFAVIAYIFFDHPHYAVAIMIGYASHLMLDSLTPAGIRWFWPSKLSIHGKYRTGGIFDWMLFVILCISIIAIVLL